MSLFHIRPAGESRGFPAEVPEFHVIEGKHRVVLAVNGSRLYLAGDRPDDAGLLDEIRELPSAAPAPQSMAEPAALSLNIAQTCNLACGYCYADEGRFGGAPQRMSLETATRAIQRHIRQSISKQVSVGFIGGEPLLNRPVLHESVRFALREAARRGVAITFGITTNGTLLGEGDRDLFRSHPFAVTVSLDGGREAHDALRPTVNGHGSFEAAIAAVAPLLANSGKADISARVTVTKKNMDVPAHIDSLAAAGFQTIGVSPLRTGPDPELQLGGGDWPELLARMKAAALADWRRARGTGERLRFANFSTALRQLYRGACNALPCGAAASYVSLSADGRYYTCHRTIGDRNFELGDLQTGPSRERRALFTASRAVDRQEPCRSCWARYLCGGGCHAEVMRVGRAGCDAIRGWLEFCISLYPEVLAERPDLLRDGPPPAPVSLGGYLQ